MPLRFIPDIHRVTHRIGLHVERAGGTGVTQAEAHLLAHLIESGESTTGELHRAFAHRRSTLTSILDRLEGRRLIVRMVDPADRRSFRVSLTRSGRRLGERVVADLDAFERVALAGVSPGELDAFRTVLRAIERTAETRPPRARPKTETARVW
jgi:DNA-binding MarR family transcriptional regulator